MKKLIAFVLVLAMCTLFACAPAAPAPGGEAAPAPAEDIVIAVIPQQLGNVVFLPAKDGMEKAASELGIKVEWAAPTSAEAEIQNAVVEGLIEKKVSAFAISCVTADGLNAVIKRALDAGIKVSCYDADAPDSGRAFYAGTENYKAGYECGVEMVKLYKDIDMSEIRIAQLEGIPGAFDIQQRMDGFAEAIKEDPRMKVVYTYPCMDDVDKSIIGIEDYTRANGDSIDAWFMAGGWPYVVEPSAMPETNKWKLAKPNRKVVTLDIFPGTSELFFAMGVLDVAIGQNFYQMGYQSVQNLYKLVKGEEVKGDTVEGITGTFINTGTDRVSVEDYKEYFNLK